MYEDIFKMYSILFNDDSACGGPVPDFEFDPTQNSTSGRSRSSRKELRRIALTNKAGVVSQEYLVSESVLDDPILLSMFKEMM